jgi:hypothetical protein
VPYVPSCCIILSFCSTWASVSKAEVAARWLRAVTASRKREFLNLVLPLDDETSQLFVRFFWLIYTEDLSAAKNLLIISRRSLGLESYFYESTASKYLEPRDGSISSSTGVPNEDRYPAGVSTSSILETDGGQGTTVDLCVSKAKSSKTFKSAGRRRSTLGSTTSFPRRLADRRMNSAFNQNERVRANKIERKARYMREDPPLLRSHLRRSNVGVDVGSSKEVASDRGVITRGKKRKVSVLSFRKLSFASFKRPSLDMMMIGLRNKKGIHLCSGVGKSGGKGSL